MLTFAKILDTLRKGHGYEGDDSLDAVKAFVTEKNICLVEGEGEAETVIDLDALHAIHVKAAARTTVRLDDTPVPGIPARRSTTSKAAAVNARSVSNTKNSREHIEKKMYDIKAATGRCAFNDADEMQEFNASFRVRAYEMYATQYPSLFGSYKANGFLDQDIEVLQKDASDSLLTAGGALLANTLKNEILWATEEWGASRWIARNEIMVGNNTSFPRRTANPSFSPLSSGAAVSTDLSYDLVTLIPKQGAALILTPLVLFEQTNTALGDTIASALMEAYWNTIDENYFNGTGTSAYFNQIGLAVGLTGTPATTTSGSYITASATAVTSWTQADFLAAMSAVKNLNTSRAKWVMSRQVYVSGPLRLATALSGNRADNLLTPQNTYMIPAQQRGEVPGGPKAFLYGEPVYFSQRMSTTTSADAGVVKAYYGDFETGSIIGHRTSLEIASSNDYAFNKRALATRAFAEWAINICGDGRASSTTCGPIAALQC